MNKGIHAGLLVTLFLAINSFSAKPSRSVGEEQVSGWPTNTIKSLDYGVLLEVEGFGSRIDGQNESDLVVATVAFDLEMAINDWMLGHVGVLWEQDSREDDNIDEAYLAFGASETIPFYLVLGRFYQPVGNFESAFISDPLTLELMEMNRTAGMVGYANSVIDLSAGAFNGDTKKGTAAGDGGDPTISDFFASVALTPVEQIKVGAYWLSDLMETYNYGNLGEDIADQPGYEKVGAAGIYANAYLGRLTLNAEFASALDDYMLGGGRYRPMAYSLEGSFAVHEKVAVGLKYEASEDLYAAYDRSLAQYGDKLPGRAYGAVVAYQFVEYASVAAEYMHLEKLENDARGDLVTVQFGLEF
ncbi:LbtU family siderophore porin [Pontiellaceae bacterium B12227]|nr:LbtU family siderophore porin [Pontiellaceae bacterium B12227]